MSMISLPFAALTALVFLALRLCGQFVKDREHKAAAGKWILLAASFLFTAYADYRFALVLAFLAGTTWFCGKRPGLRKLGILAALLCLGYFKYSNFFIESISGILGRKDPVVLKLLLPLGISFYSFSAISYLADLSRGVLEPRSLPEVALYLSFFPKITSGPIQRSKDFFQQTDAPRNVGWESFCAGIQIYMVGLFKKIVLADRLSVFVNQVYGTPKAFDSLTILLAVLAYSLQIYFDFSGYSDMAVGAARILDIRLPQNFNLPYLSHNVTEFWKRWHITLSSWLQDYLYIPLGGNRKGVLRTYCNLIITMVLGGIWHGASWTYVIWGLLHGGALVVHKLWSSFSRSLSKTHSVLSNTLSVMGTFFFVSLAWVFFRADSVSHALLILGRLFSFAPGVRQLYVWFFFALAVLCGSSGAAVFRARGEVLPPNRRNVSKAVCITPALDLSGVWQLTLFFVFCGLILGLAYTGGSPFIYGAY